MKKNVFMRAILMLVVLALAQTTWAQSEVQCLALAYTDSSEVDYFALSEGPVITYGDWTITVKQGEKDAYSIEDISLDKVEKYYFEKAVPTSIGGISAGEASMTGLTEGAHVYVYTADGRMVSTATAGKDGRIDLDLNSLPRGQVYIVRTPMASYKIVK